MFIAVVVISLAGVGSAGTSGGPLPTIGGPGPIERQYGQAVTDCLNKESKRDLPLVALIKLANRCLPEQYARAAGSAANSASRTVAKLKKWPLSGDTRVQVYLEVAASDMSKLLRGRTEGGNSSFPSETFDVSDLIEDSLFSEFADGKYETARQEMNERMKLNPEDFRKPANFVAVASLFFVHGNGLSLKMFEQFYMRNAYCFIGDPMASEDNGQTSGSNGDDP